MLTVRIVFKLGWGTNHQVVSCVNHPVEKKIHTDSCFSSGSMESLFSDDSAILGGLVFTSTKFGENEHDNFSRQPIGRCLLKVGFSSDRHVSFRGGQCVLI